MSQDWSFPQLKASQICSHLRDQGLLKGSNLKAQPKEILAEPVLLESVYEHYVIQFTSFNWREYSVPSFHAAERSGLTDNDLHEHSIGRLAFLKTLKKLMDKCGVHDFSLRDLQRPQHRRTCNNLSALINFGQFRRDRLQEYKAHEEALEGLQQQLSNDREENELVKSIHEKHRSQNELQAPELKKIEDDSKKLHDSMRAMNRQQIQLKDDVAQLHRNDAQVKKQIETQRFDLAAKRKENEVMQEGIVKSPSRIKKTVARMRENVKTKKQAVHHAKTDSRLADKRMKNIQTIGSTLQERSEIMAALHTLSKNIQASKANALTLKKEIELADDSMKRLDAKYVAIKENVHKQTTKMRQEDDERLKQTQEANDKYREATDKKREMETAVSADNEQIENLNAELKKSKALITQLQEKHANEIHETRTELNEYIQKVIAEMKAVLDVIGNEQRDYPDFES